MVCAGLSSRSGFPTAFPRSRFGGVSGIPPPLRYPSALRSENGFIADTLTADPPGGVPPLAPSRQPTPLGCVPFLTSPPGAGGVSLGTCKAPHRVFSSLIRKSTPRTHFLSPPVFDGQPSCPTQHIQQPVRFIPQKGKVSPPPPGSCQGGWGSCQGVLSKHLRLAGGSRPNL